MITETQNLKSDRYQALRVNLFINYGYYSYVSYIQ